MKITSPNMVSALALSGLQGGDPILFEKSFQTLNSSSLSWIDEGLLSQVTKIQKSEKHVFDVKLETMDNDSGKYHYHRVVAEALIRRIVFRSLDKHYQVSSPERVSEALKYHFLHEKLQHELVDKYGGVSPSTWFDAIKQLENFCGVGGQVDNGKSYDRSNGASFNKEMLWELILDHPMTSYVPVQCQSCGRYTVPDDNPHSSRSDDADLGLKEVTPSPDEAPFVRTGWFRGPRLLPSVFVIDCPECGAVSRWFRSRDPQIILNPHRWGRLCGEQEDLRLDLANYLGFISMRTIIPLDWDHIWSEFRIIDEDSEECCDENSSSCGKWRLQNDDRNFAARLDEGVGSWTRVLAVSPNPDFCCDVTKVYLSCEAEGGLVNNQMMPDMKRYTAQVNETRRDRSGTLTQAGTINGYVIQRAGLTSSEITVIMRRAAKDYGMREWYQV